MHLTKFWKTSILAAISLGLVSMTFCFLLMFRVRKTGYVDTVKLLNQYQLKIDLEKIEEVKLSSIRFTSDSLMAIYKTLKPDPATTNTQLKEIENRLTQLQSIFQQEYQRSNESINEKLWKRLNEPCSTAVTQRIIRTS